MAEFKVVLEGIELSEQDSKEIERGIQGVVLKHLASIDTRGRQAATAFTLPPGIETQGLIAVMADLTQLGEIGPSLKEIGAREFGG